jgi:transcriptional regulator with XRE-family HTH domain
MSENGFGTWLRATRQAKKRTLQQLADATDIDLSTINRIEKGRSQPKLTTVVRLCRALNVSAEQLWSDLQAEHHVEVSPLNHEDAEVFHTRRMIATIPTNTFSYIRGEAVSPSSVMDSARALSIPDVVALVTCLHQTPAMGIAIVQRMLNMLADDETLSARVHFEGRDVEWLFESTPYYHCTIPYPTMMPARVIMDIYQQGNVLIEDDVHHFLHRFVQEVPIPPTAQKGVQRQVDHMMMLSLDRILLSDIIDLDRALSQHGQLFAHYWLAHEMHTQVVNQHTNHHFGRTWPSVWSEREHTWCNQLLRLHRWLVFQGHDDISWIREHLRNTTAET